MLCDSHCHLEDGMPHDIDLMINIGCDLESSKQSIEWTRKENRIYGTVGVHPEFADLWDSKLESEIGSLSKDEKIVAIGEIGLDYHWDDNPARDLQRKCFEDQIELAKKLKMPICIHSRDADQETMDILKAHDAFNGAGVLLHCFSGSAELARQYVKLGAYISIAGPVTYKNNRKTIEVVESVPLERLLIETDSPYLSPEPMRGKPNCPENVKYTANKIAEIKGISFEEVAEATYQNACRFYSITNN